jgi:hypothetical protein
VKAFIDEAQPKNLGLYDEMLRFALPDSPAIERITAQFLN